MFVKSPLKAYQSTVPSMGSWIIWKLKKAQLVDLVIQCHSSIQVKSMALWKIVTASLVTSAQIYVTLWATGLRRWASTPISMSAISDIRHRHSDIGDKYVGLKNVIPISEVFRYWHQSSFRYPTLKKNKYFTVKIRTRGSSDIRLSSISLITDIGLSAHLCWSTTGTMIKLRV